MSRLVVILLACLCKVQCQSNANISVVDRLPDFIHEFCPGVNICSTNQTISATSQNSCCVECSCEPYCKVNGNCCFPETTASYPGLSERDRELQYELSCVYPMSPQPNEENRIFHHSFYMVSSVGKRVHGSFNKVSESPCGKTKVAPWGNLYPMYSAKSEKIYINEKCAQEDGIIDGIFWDVLITCLPEEVIDGTIGLESNTFPENCVIHFVYPGDLNVLQTSICYSSFVKTCPETPEFLMPEGTSLSKNDIVKLCTSGLMSPYPSTKMYANVFCHICNAEYFSKLFLCDKRTAGGLKGVNTKGFTALIDQSFIYEQYDDKTVKGEVIKWACSLYDNGMCRHVLCPSGQLRNKRGRCVYPAKLWYNQNYGVFVNLTAEKQIDVTVMFKVPFGATFTTVLPLLESHWEREWSVFDIFYKETGNNSSFSDNFIVFIKRKIFKVKPNNIIQYIRHTVKSPWYISLNNEKVLLKSADFTKLTAVYTYVDSTRISVFENQMEAPVKPQYNYIYQSPFPSDLDNHIITKLYVCEQVELTPSEFILSHDESILYNNITKRFLFDGEFAILKSNVFDGLRARICIEDSGLHKMDKVAMRNIGTVLRTCILNCYAVAPGLLIVVLYVNKFN